VSGPDYFRRTAVTRLAVEADDRERLLSMVREWKRGCQIAVNAAWGVCHTRNEVQQLAYEKLRERTRLGSQHAVLATHRAAEAIKGALERGDDGVKPEFTSPTVVYDSRTLTLFDDRRISLTTTGDRVRCRLVFPDHGYQSQYLDDDRWTEDATVLGVSLGVENLAVTSTARFFSGTELTHRHAEFTDLRDDLRETNTRSARRTLRQANERIKNFTRNTLHEIAGEIVSEAEAHGCSVVAFGELEGVQEMLEKATPFHGRAFERLFEFVSYRAAERDITVVQVNPEYTSQRCTSCGFTHPQNRDVDANRFECLKCGNEANDDYNAAKNVGFRCIRRGPLSSRGVGAKYCALRSGRVTPDGEFIPNRDLEAVQKP
jgi:putative transposase